MIVARQTMMAKRGMASRIAAILKQERERTGDSSRIYVSRIGTLDSVAVEMEFENLAAYDEFFGEYLSTPEYREFAEKLHPLLDRGDPHEIWTLIE